MKLSVRIPLLMGIVVLITTVSSVLPIEIIMGDKIRTSYLEELSIKAEANAELIRTRIEGRLAQLWEIANRSTTRTMDWYNVVQPSLFPDIARIGALELIVIYPPNINHYVTDDSRASPPLAAYSLAAFDGRAASSDVIISQVINDTVLMLTAPIFASNAPGAPVAGVLMAQIGRASCRERV